VRMICFLSSGAKVIAELAGASRDGLAETMLAQVEDVLRPTFNTLPQNEHGHLFHGPFSLGLEKIEDLKPFAHISNFKISSWAKVTVEDVGEEIKVGKSYYAFLQGKGDCEIGCFAFAKGKPKWGFRVRAKGQPRWGWKANIIAAKKVIEGGSEVSFQPLPVIFTSPTGPKHFSNLLRFDATFPKSVSEGKGAWRFGWLAPKEMIDYMEISKVKTIGYPEGDESDGFGQNGGFVYDMKDGGGYHAFYWKQS